MDTSLRAGPYVNVTVILADFGLLWSATACTFSAGKLIQLKNGVTV